MKIQDIIFFIILITLFLTKRDFKWFVTIGIVFLLFSIPLFAGWVFFTAERFTWYAAGIILIAIILSLFKAKKYE